MAQQTEAFELRWSHRTVRLGFLLWVALCGAATTPSFREHIAYFGERLGPLYQWAIIGTLAALAVWAAAYVRLRRGGLWRYEPRMLLGLCAVLTLWGAPWGLPAACLMGAVCFAAGAAALDSAGLPAASPAARLGLAGAAGVGLLALAMIPIGMAGAYSPATFWMMTVASCLLWRRRLMELPGLLAALDRQWRETPAYRSPVMGVAVAMLPAFLASFALASTAPAIAYDAVSHHLPAARHYLESGALEPLPVPPGAFDARWLYTLGHAVAYSYYPQSFEELLTFAWGLGGQPAAQLVAPLTCLLSMLLLVSIGRLCGLSPLGCALGAVAGFTLPFAHWIGAITKNDYLLALFQLASVYALLRARRGDGPRWLTASAFFLGSSVGVKHTAIFLGFPLGLLLLWELHRQVRPVRLAASMALVFLLSGFFWHARTYVLTGNPLYPATAGRGAIPARAMDGTLPSRWTVYWTYPWYVHFDGRKVMELPSRSPAGFFFLFFTPLWLFYKRRRRALGEGGILFALLLFYLYWAYIWGVLRYGLGPALLFALLTTDRLAALAEGAPAARRVAAVSLVYCCAFALLPTLMFEINAPQIAWYAGRSSRDGYLRAAMSDYPAIAFLNQRQGPGDTVLAVNNCSSAYAVDPARFRCVRYGTEMGSGVIGAIAGVVEQSKPDYLVLPTGEIGAFVLQFLPAGQWAAPVFEDGAFRVFPRARQ